MTTLHRRFLSVAPEAAQPRPLRPNVAVVAGVLAAMFSLTFLLLLYIRHCKRNYDVSPAVLPSSSSGCRRDSGVDRAVVESLPVFRFGALLGHKDGLECAVCLARFEPAESLRLLPKCRHAFHVECVDTWLDAHSSCPLCRSRVHPEDVLLLPPDPPAPPPPAGRRISGRHSSAGEKSAAKSQTRPPRRSVDPAALRAVANLEKGRKDGLLLPSEQGRFGHQIVVDDSGGGPERWSDLRPSELLFLRTEMIVTDSGRFSASRVGGSENRAEERSMSEIAGVNRAGDRGGGRRRRREEDERTMRRWLGFSRTRTARWLGSGSGSRGGGGGGGGDVA